MQRILAKLVPTLEILFYAPNPPITPTPTSNAPKANNGQGAKVGVFGTHQAKAKRNPRNSRGQELLGERI